MSKLRIGVLRGGPSPEYEPSLQTGAAVLDCLRNSDQYEDVDLLITKDGTWHYQGLPVRKSALTQKVDFIFNALHGHYGEDGQVARELDRLLIKHNSHSPLAGALAMNKIRAKEIFQSAGIRTPYGIYNTPDENLENFAKRIFYHLPPPWVIKPASNGSSIGLSLARNFPELISAIKLAGQHNEQILAEEYLRGREMTVGVIRDFRQKDFYTLPSLEIILAGSGPKAYHYDHKYEIGDKLFSQPHDLSEETKTELSRLAVLAHQSLGLDQYSRADFRLTPRGIYLLEVNSLPGLMPQSSFVHGLKSIGSNLSQFIKHVIGG